MKASLFRTFLIAVGLLLSTVVLFVGWIALTYSACDYQMSVQRISPSGRYAAEYFGADCGMGDYRNVVTLRDLSVPALPRLDGSPPGTWVSRDFTLMDDRANDIRWESEEVLVLEYTARTPPELERTEWGGVRIEARQVPKAP